MCSVVSISLRPRGLQPTRLFCPWDTGVGGHFLLQGIFQTQGLNLHRLCFLQWQAGSFQLMPTRKLGGKKIRIFSDIFSGSSQIIAYSILIGKPGEDTTRKVNCKPVFLVINIDAIILNRIFADQIKRYRIYVIIMTNFFQNARFN